MANMNKRLLAMLLTMAVAFSLMSVGIYAQDAAVVNDGNHSQNEWPEIQWPEMELPEITIPEIVGPVEIVQPAQPLRPEGPVQQEEPQVVELPQEDVPLTETPEELPEEEREEIVEIPGEVDIQEEDVPLAAVPQTGDAALLYTLMATLSGAGLAWMGRKKD